jgi:hypothetical protein
MKPFPSFTQPRGGFWGRSSNLNLVEATRVASPAHPLSGPNPATRIRLPETLPAVGVPIVP